MKNLHHLAVGVGSFRAAKFLTFYQANYNCLHCWFPTAFSFCKMLLSMVALWANGVVVSMFDFHRSDRGSNPSRGSKMS